MGGHSALDECGSRCRTGFSISVAIGVGNRKSFETRNGRIRKYFACV